jgi:mRNA interferase MazF
MAYYTNDRDMEILRGDIFFVSPGGNYCGSEQKPNRPAIVVSNDLANKHSPNVEMVFLTSQEKKPLPTHVEVIAKVPSTALCENIQTVSKERLGDFLKSCTTTEMKKIDEALLISLGMKSSAPLGGGD